jgi:hypothetical protein
MPKSHENPHLGKKLLEAMSLKNVKQVEVADHFKVKPPTVSGDWIKFGRIGKKHFPELVSYFGLPYAWWFGEEEKAGSAAHLTAEQQKILQLFEKMTQAARDNWIANGELITSVIPTVKTVDTQEAEQLESMAILQPEKLKGKDSAFRDFKADPLFKPGGNSRADGKKTLNKKEGNK